MGFSDTLATYPATAFTGVVDSLVVSKTKPPLTLADLTSIVWSEIGMYVCACVQCIRVCASVLVCVVLGTSLRRPRADTHSPALRTYQFTRHEQEAARLPTITLSQVQAAYNVR